jgi:hypothetical protein
MNGNGDTVRADPSPQVVDAVASAYYGRKMTAPDAARERAQRSYAAAGVIATTLLAAGGLTDVAERAWYVEAAGFLALGLWVAVGFAYVRAVGAPVAPRGPEAARSASAFVDAALLNTSTELAEIERRHEKARLWGIAAIAVTIAAVALVLFVPQSQERIDATVLVSRDGGAALAGVCGGAPPARGRVAAELDAASLGEDYVELRLDPPTCGRSEAHVRLPRAAVLAVRER